MFLLANDALYIMNWLVAARGHAVVTSRVNLDMEAEFNWVISIYEETINMDPVGCRWSTDVCNIPVI